jgi:hypothetical protein
VPAGTAPKPASERTRVPTRASLWELNGVVFAIVFGCCVSTFAPRTRRSIPIASTKFTMPILRAQMPRGAFRAPRPRERAPARPDRAKTVQNDLQNRACNFRPTARTCRHAEFSQQFSTRKLRFVAFRCVSARFAKAHETIDSIDFIGEIASFWRAVFPVSNPSSGTTPKPGVNEHRAVLVASILLLLHWQTVDADAPAVCTAIPNSRRRKTAIGEVSTLASADRKKIGATFCFT